MKKRAIFLLLSFWLCAASGSQAANVDVGINVNIGAPAIVIDSPPEFLLVPSLGLHISIGAPYDLFYLDGFYYHFQNNRWYRSNHYQGPWGYVDRGHLPKRMHKHEYREMLDYRDREYQDYKKDREHHRDRYFRPNGPHENHAGKQENKGKRGHKEK